MNKLLYKHAKEDSSFTSDGYTINPKGLLRKDSRVWIPNYQALKQELLK